ncbi:MAG: hypothetical protein ABJB40_00370 [Acidobacteriota bacterium]
MKKLSPILLILFLCALGCNMSSIKNLVSGGAKGTATGGSDPKADIIEASKKFIALPFFTANTEGMGQTEIKSQVQFAAPDSFHIKYMGGTGAGMEMIYIGKNGFMKSNNAWTKMPDAGSIPNLRDSFTEAGLKTLTDAKYEGEDTLDGKPMAVYSYKNVTPVGAYPFTCKMWVNSSGVPAKIHAEYTNGMLKYMDVKYDTETPVKIEAPIS